MRKISFLSAAALAALSTFGWAQKAEAQATTSWSGASETREGEQRFKVRGRVQWDVYSVSTESNATGAGADNFDGDYTRSGFRRVRLGVEGRFTDDWRYKAEISLLPGNTVEYEDVFVEYTGSNFSLILGNNKAIAPLEEATSSRFITFNERAAMISAFDYGRQLGAVVMTNGGNWGLGAGAYGNSPNTADGTAANSDLDNNTERLTLQARGYFAPVMDATPEGTTLWMIGATARYRDAGDDAGSLRYRARPAGVGFGDRYIDTGEGGGLADISSESDTAFTIESAAIFGPFSLQAEYGWLEVERDGPLAVNQFDPTFEGGYVDAIWNITGENRVWRVSDGTFQRTPVARPLHDGGPGLWQVAARFETLQLGDGVGTTGATGVNSGELEAYTLGLHWYPHPQVGFKLNFAHTEITDSTWDNPSGGPDFNDGEVNAISFRTQFDW